MIFSTTLLFVADLLVFFNHVRHLANQEVDKTSDYHDFVRRFYSYQGFWHKNRLLRNNFSAKIFILFIVFRDRALPDHRLSWALRQVYRPREGSAHRFQPAAQKAFRVRQTKKDIQLAPPSFGSCNWLRRPSVRGKKSFQTRFAPSELRSKIRGNWADEIRPATKVIQIRASAAADVVKSPLATLTRIHACAPKIRGNWADAIRPATKVTLIRASAAADV